MTITAKYASRCGRCHQAIQAGSLIEWERGRQPVHASICPAPQPQVQVVAPFDPAGIRALLQTAKDRGLKAPKVRFLAPDGESELLLSMAPDSGRNPGALYIKVAGEYLGMVTREHTLRGRLDQTLLDTLTAIALDPATAARRYGALTCRCSFCGLPLTDAGSVEVGYGPICADRYNLPHRPQGTPVLTETVPTDLFTSELPASRRSA